LSMMGLEGKIAHRKGFSHFSLRAGDFSKRRGDLAVLNLDFNGQLHRLAVRQEKSYGVLSLSLESDPHNEVSNIIMCVGKGGLGVIGVETSQAFRRRGYNALLRRCAYLCAGQPDRVILHNMAYTNPFFNEVAEEFLNSGYFRKFWPKRMVASMERMFGASVRDAALLKENRIQTVLTRDYDVAVDLDTRFYVELVMDPN